MSAALTIPPSSHLEPQAWRSLRAVVLLAGAVRQTRLDALVGRPIFDLPLDKGRSILDDWRQQVQQLSDARGRGPLPMRIMMNRSAAVPEANGPAAPHASEPAPTLRVERDPFDYRGAGGVLRDVSIDYQDDDFLLVANAAQVLMQPLADLAMAMAQSGGDVTIVSHADGTPSGLSLVRCGAVRDLPAEGFVDFKEQALPSIAGRYRVHVLELDHPSALPVRTLANYTAALRRYHQQKAGLAGRADGGDPFAEGWESAYSIIEDGAEVHSSAQLNDAVVLRGGRVEAETVLARSLVCPGGVLRRQQVAVDALVRPGGNGRM